MKIQNVKFVLNTALDNQRLLNLLMFMSDPHWPGAHSCFSVLASIFQFFTAQFRFAKFVRLLGLKFKNAGERGPSSQAGFTAQLWFGPRGSPRVLASTLIYGRPKVSNINSIFNIHTYCNIKYLGIGYRKWF